MTKNIYLINHRIINNTRRRSCQVVLSRDMLSFPSLCMRGFRGDCLPWPTFCNYKLSSAGKHFLTGSRTRPGEGKLWLGHGGTVFLSKAEQWHEGLWIRTASKENLTSILLFPFNFAPFQGPI